MNGSDAPTSYAAVLLAGGAGRRLAGADKPGLRIGGRPLVHHVLDAVADAAPRVVVGPPRDLPGDVLTTREDPPGGGPVAAIAAGLALLDDRSPAGSCRVELVALLAADLPFLTRDAVRALRDAAVAGGRDAAVYTDGSRRQYLCAVWRLDALRRRLRELGPPRDAALRRLYEPARIAEITSPADPPPWYDCDTEDDLRRAEAWFKRGLPA